MEKQELEELKGKVPCAAVLEHLGFTLDVKESTRKAMKYRRDAQIIIVIHDGKAHKPTKGDPQVSWWAVANVLAKTRMYARDASFGDELAQA